MDNVWIRFNGYVDDGSLIRNFSEWFILEGENDEFWFVSNSIENDEMFRKEAWEHLVEFCAI